MFELESNQTLIISGACLAIACCICLGKINSSKQRLLTIKYEARLELGEPNFIKLLRVHFAHVDTVLLNLNVTAKV